MNHEPSVNLAPFIDHTLLKPEATRSDIEALCQEARLYKFKTVCVNPLYIPLAAKLLAGGPTVPISVIGFPLGATFTANKVHEAKLAVQAGAQEIDMVLAIGALKDGDLNYVRRDISAVVEACGHLPVKVIIETALLTHSEKVLACQLSEQAGAAFVKSCSGFSGGGATVEDIRLMRAAVSAHVKVKASGGIRDRATALAMLDAGAQRLGTSSGVAIMNAKSTTQGGY